MSERNGQPEGNLAELPPGWCWATVGELGEVRLGRQRSPKNRSEQHPTKYIRAANITWTGLDVSDVMDMEFKPSELETYRLLPGDVLLSEASGSPREVGKPAIWRGEIEDCCFQNTVIRFRPEAMPPEFPFVVFCHFARNGIFSRAGKGVGIHHLSADRFTSLAIPLAPLNEQRRIVAKIEELFSDLDAGVAALVRIKANLKRYRAAVLKAAVEGRLTEAWRAKHPKTEPASKLLERIQAERRQKWEEDQLSKFAAADKPPPKGWRDSYTDPTPPDLTHQFSVPASWCVVSIDQIAECLDHKRIPVNKDERKQRQGDVPYYGANGLVGYIDGYLFDEPLVLVVEDETFVGRQIPFSYKITGKSWVNNHAHILRPRAIDTDFLNYSLMYYPFVPLTTGTTARRKLTKAKLLSAPLAFPPLEEQRQVVSEIEMRLSCLEAVQASLDANLLRSGRLRQSILKRAFEGKLVPQDPTDEPADKLLERIRQERTATNGSVAPRTRRGRTAKQAES